MTITLRGRVISKKNSPILVKGRAIRLPSKAYSAFRDAALWQLKSHRERFVKPLEVCISFELKGRMDADLDNLVSSVFDVLQDSGIITDDKLVERLVATKSLGHSDWVTNIDIREVWYESLSNAQAYQP